MVTKAENELLTLVEGDAPMGQMMRQNHWIPAVRAGRLEADGDPIRVRLFGENFVAFRATDGQVGFFDEACPHRGASLALARNEEGGLRCIFHGWKFSAQGKCVEAPTQALNQEAFACNVKVRHYPLREAGGLVWVWLGAGEPGRFADLPFTHMGNDEVFVASTKIPVNYLQGLEATLDSSHIGFLHRDWFANPDPGSAYVGSMSNFAPTYEVRDTDYGFRAAALRRLPGGVINVRCNEFVMPFHSSTSTGKQGEGTYQILVPIDNENTLWIFVRWDENEPVDRSGGRLAPVNADLDDWVPPLGGPDQYWGQDRKSMKNGSFAGFRAGLLTEDTVVQISMGPIVDRTRENLCTGDAAVVRVRRRLLQAAQDHLEGRKPVGVDPATSYDRLAAMAGDIHEGDDWDTVRFA